MPLKGGYKKHWLWVVQGEELTQQNLEASYRLNSKPHSTCRKNCRTNPLCVTGFGESRWIQREMDDAYCIKRGDESYAGLRNLGNTCYINCFLQFWFHNEPLREAIYSWNPFEDDNDLSNATKPYSNVHKSSISKLQILFVQMEFGFEMYYDPSEFCASLSINVELQQDAQEFGKLFMTCMEEVFSNSTSLSEESRNVIKTQFQGRYSYVTTCRNCFNVSRQTSNFYELDLNMNDTLEASLAEFLKEDSLVGDDKYFCTVCDEKQEATRRIKLEKLPNVLQLQLLRYYFDITALSKKKITQAIAFPKALDMSCCIGKPLGTEIYELQAVLMHGGTSANTGHYYAYINTNQGWHLFDDTKVKEIESLKDMRDCKKSSSKQADEELKGLSMVKGLYSSSAVYMLAYRKQVPKKDDEDDEEEGENEEKKETPSEITEETIRMETDPADDRSETTECSMKQDEDLLPMEIEQADDDTLNTLDAPKDKPHLPVYIQKILDHHKSFFHLRRRRSPPKKIIPILKPYERAKFEKLPIYVQQIVGGENDKFMIECSRITEDRQSEWNHASVVEKVFAFLPCDDFEHAEFICKQTLLDLVNFKRTKLNNSPIMCVHGMVDFKQFNEYKFVSKEAVDIYIKQYGGGTVRLPISKLCRICVEDEAAQIRSQLQLEADRVLSMELLKAAVKLDEPGFWISKASIKVWSKVVGAADAPKLINADITCPHGQLLHPQKLGRLVSKQYWDLIKKYFPGVTEFSNNSIPCGLCISDAQDSLRECIQGAMREKELLKSLLNERQDTIENDCYIISFSFVTAWRRFIRSLAHQVMKARPATCFLFQSILCVHNLLICNPISDIERVFILSSKEWSSLKELYGSVTEIKIIKQPDGSISFSVGMCEECIARNAFNDKIYKGSKIYVYKVSNEVEASDVVETTSEVKPDDRKRKIARRKTAPPKPQPIEPPRRSTRSRISKEDKICFPLEHNTTLKDLKIMICNQLCILPCDQHLFYADNDLDNIKERMCLQDHEATFVRIAVPPYSVIRLVADEPSPEMEALTDCGPSQPETGFKGTGLGQC